MKHFAFFNADFIRIPFYLLQYKVNSLRMKVFKKKDVFCIILIRILILDAVFNEDVFFTKRFFIIQLCFK